MIAPRACAECGAELPERPPGTPGRPPRRCTDCRRPAERVERFITPDGTVYEFEPLSRAALRSSGITLRDMDKTTEAPKEDTR